MGETGCGKTRLIRYMCELAKTEQNKRETNMIILKVHMYKLTCSLNLIAIATTTIDTIDSVPWIGNNATCMADPSCAAHSFSISKN